MNTSTNWMDRLMHDLRGPLMPLQTAAYLLKHERAQLDPVRQEELIDIVQRQSQRMGRMLEEFGDWSRAQQGRVLRDFSRCDLSAVLDQAIGAVSGCHMDTQLGPQCAGARVDCDEFRLVQALRTLVEYSHARNGTATLEIECDHAHALLQLQDRGGPFDEAHAASLFEHPEHAPRDDGLGLRMLVARAIIEGHGGSVRAAPLPDGLLITCKLPLAGGTLP